jgi:hypothetical protein
MNKLIIGLLGVGTLGVGYALYRAFVPYRAPLLIVQTGSIPGAGEIMLVARSLGRALGVEPQPAASPADVLRIISARSNIHPLVFVGHGSTAGLFSNTITARNFAPIVQALAARLPRGFVLSLNSCRTGANRRETNWVEPYRSGGAGGFASLLRDALARAGAPAGEIRAHSGTGIHGNPSGRIFEVSRPGQPGVSLMSQQWGEPATADRSLARTWGSAVRGAVASRWIIGEDVRVPRA